MEESESKRQGEDLNLLKLNYEKLHESIWNNHKISWTVTSIFIPVLFAVQGYFVKEYYALRAFQVVLGIIGMEFLLIVWLSIMRIFHHYNKARIERLKEIEEFFDGLISDDIKTHFKNQNDYGLMGFNLYNLPFRENWKKFYFSPMSIYYMFFGAHTLINMALVITVIA